MPSLLKHPKSAYELEKKSCLKEYKRGSYLGSTGMLILGLSEPRIQPWSKWMMQLLNDPLQGEVQRGAARMDEDRNKQSTWLNRELLVCSRQPGQRSRSFPSKDQVPFPRYTSLVCTSPSTQNCKDKFTQEAVSSAKGTDWLRTCFLTKVIPNKKCSPKPL